VYDAVVEAGRDLGLLHAGYHALDSLRCEKGYRHLGHDIGPGLDPAEAGLTFAVSTRKQTDFVGRAALRRDRKARWRTSFVRLDDPSQLLHRDEPVLRDGRQIGRVTSGAYGWTVGGSCGVALIDEGEAQRLDDGRCAVTVTCGTTPVPATLSPQPFYDPTGSRLR
jgi:4-methylaminobutanoate oxidase (formaldehyde-forming)